MPILKSISAELPDPPYPSVRAGDFPFDLDVNRMLASDTWAITPHEIRPWCLMAWAISWVQTPAGTLPSDEEVLAVRLGCSRRFLADNRKYILRNWYLCSDMRLYHPVVRELVTILLSRRETWRNSQKRGRGKNRVQKNQEVSQNVNVDSTQISVESTPSSSSSSSSSSSCTTTNNLSSKADLPGSFLSREPKKSEPNGENPGTAERRNQAGECGKFDESPQSTSEPASTATPTSRATLPPWEDVKQVIDLVNEKSGRRHSLKNTRGKHTADALLIRDRLRDWSLEDALRVVDMKADEWLGDEKMSQYFRIGTLFAKKNFEQYRAQTGKTPNVRIRRRAAL